MNISYLKSIVPFRAKTKHDLILVYFVASIWKLTLAKSSVIFSWMFGFV